MQETFLKAILSLPNDHVNVKAWLYLVARNLYLNYYNHEKRIVPLEEIENFSADPTAALLEHIIHDEQKQLLYKALQQLPERQREILLLHYFSGLSLKEIAVILKQTPENIRIQAYRGKKELKNYMEVHNHDLS